MTAVAETAVLTHGYTMADVQRIAKVAVKKHHRSRGTLDQEEREDTAWHAVVVALYAQPDDAGPPAFFDLLRAGMAALDEELNWHKHHHGVNHSGEEAPGFLKYWLPARQERSDGFTDHLVELVALPSALAVLTDLEYEALATLAAFDNNSTLAAEALQVSYSKFTDRVRYGRARFKAAWYGDETPPSARRFTVEKTCRSGHSRAEHGKQHPDGHWVCKVCTRNASRRRAAKHGW